MQDPVRGAAVVIVVGRGKGRFEGCHWDDRLTRLLGFAYRFGVAPVNGGEELSNTLALFSKSPPSHLLPAAQSSRPTRFFDLKCRIHKLAYNIASLWRCADAPRFRGYELPVHAGRSAADGARLCRQAGGALRHHPSAMGGAGQDRTRRGPQAVGTRRTDGNAADHADAADRQALRRRLDRAPQRRQRPPRQPALPEEGGAPAARQARRACAPN